MKKNIFKILSCSFLFITSFSSFATNWDDPWEVANEFNNEYRTLKLKQFEKKWHAFPFTLCVDGTCYKLNRKEYKNLLRETIIKDDPCNITDASWVGYGRLKQTCNGVTTLITAFNDQGKAYRTEVLKHP